MPTEAIHRARAQRRLARGGVLRTLFALAVATAALAVAAAAWGASVGPAIASHSVERTTGRGDAFVLPPWLEYRGRSLAEWQRAYFKWASRIPTDGPQPHPGLTEGNVDCSHAQRGQLWFLELGGVERRCSIPFGKTLYVPVNFWACLPEADLIPFPQCEAEGDGFLDAATFTLTLDGSRLDLGAWRTDTGRFRLRLADQNVWEAFFGFADLGRSTPFSADGVGALVALGPGEHTIVAEVAIDVDGDGTPDHASETSYELTVVSR
jgi:hypothetical protein